MEKRIRRILLVCSNYDSYALEEDGRIEARITKEYSDLNLSNPPVIVRAESTVEALALVEGGEHVDLVITMYNVGEVDVFSFSARMKALAPETPIVLLTSFSRELYRQIDEKDTSSIDYMFCWMNSPDLIIAIIKLLEDKLNAEEDILDGGVQAILLVEDSVRYYSTYLPLLYKIVLQQNTASLKEALNENQQIARKRARPKILMATSYNEAVSLFDRYSENLLGVISDIGFVVNRGDRPETEKLDAGIDLCDHIRKRDPKMPILLQSSQESMRSVAEKLKVGFVIKQSKTLTAEVSKYIEREFAFGDFIFSDPVTGEVSARAHDLRELEEVLKTADQGQYAALVEKNYVSKWLFARGLFSIAKIIRPLSLSDTLRQTTIKAIRDYRVKQALGVVAKFDPETFNDTMTFSKLGDGSVGGKARGLSFLNHILQKYDLYNKWEGIRVTVPRTLVVTTDYFDTFIEENGLRYVINSDFSDEEILSEFVASTLPKDLTEALKVFIHSVRKPLAVRSSSKLEDSYYQPFAGVYSTYMIPVSDDPDQQFRMLAKAIKSVYASVYYASSRSYITASANVISEEKMAVIVEEICGSRDGERFFPTLSGVARSINFYPIGYEKA
ncbi:MAG: phosphoenolpyruvate synthase, partial [Bacteroidales bacterium]|nr:phosphoenolpyruvate synthase [Bacteroidales bacterium]